MQQGPTIDRMRFADPLEAVDPDASAGNDAPVALVTGASQGIGRAVATALHARGHRVALLARTADRLTAVADELGQRALPLAGDVSQPADVAAAVDVLADTWGRIDLAVHAAGTARAIGPLWEADPDQWWREVAGHLRGAMLLARACLPGMVARGSGRLVLLHGNLGEGGDPWSSAYAAGKAGVLRLVEQLHAELADTGVVVLGLHPGLVWTPMTATLAQDPEVQRWLPRFAQRDRSDYGSTDAVEAMVAAVAAGRLDAMSGLVLGAWEDPSELLAEVDDLRAAGRRSLHVTW